MDFWGWLRGKIALPVAAVKRFTVEQWHVNSVKTPAAVVEISRYEPPKGVIPAPERAASLAMDATPYDYVNSVYGGSAAFKGYPYLANLAQLPEYRKFSETIAQEMTRKFIKFTSRGGGDKTDKLTKLHQAFERLKVQEAFQKCAELDGFYGRGQVYVEMKTAKGGALASEDPEELQSALIKAPAKITKGSLVGFRAVEPVWTYPSQYNATDPLSKDFYRPLAWYVMGKTVHSSRVLTFVSRPVPDLLKAAYNFGGVSLSQLMEPYVNNWLRTRDSVSDMIHSYSTTGIKVDMAQMLSSAADADSFLRRIELFTQTRDNRGMMVVDKDAEDFFQINTPLSGLSDLQEQAAGHLSMISSLPPLKLFGIAPSGLNASGQGEMQVFYDFITALRENMFTDNLNAVCEIVQLSEFGEIDPDITWEFEPLAEMTDKEIADLNKTKSDTDTAYINAGAISAEEVRVRLAADETSGYNGLDVEAVPEGEEPEPKKDDKQAQDAAPGEKWITINGAKVLLDGNGSVIGGAGGNLTQKKQEPHKIETKQAINVKIDVPSVVKSMKGKAVKTDPPKGNIIELPTGLRESQYSGLIEAADELYSKSKDSPDAYKAAGYLKRSIEIASEDKKYQVSIQTDDDGNIIGAVATHPLPDSIRIETLGGLGKGAGTSCLLSVVRQSKKAGKGGAITLTPIASAIPYYERIGFIPKTGSQYGELFLSASAASDLEKKWGKAA